MRFRTRVGVLVGLLAAIGGVCWAWTASLPAADLNDPARADSFLELGKVQPFSHEELFAVDVKKTDAVVRLTLTDMIALAQKNRLDGSVSLEKVNEALGRRWQAMGPLLPQVQGVISQSRTFKENLEAQGMHGYGTIGPFNTFDARLNLMQKIIDVSAASGFQVARSQVTVARYEQAFTRQKIVLASSLSYLEALHAQGTFHAAEAGVALSERLLRQTEARKQAGTAAGIEVARARTRLAEDNLHLERCRTGLHDAYLDIQRSTGISYDQVIELMNSLCFVRETVPAVPEALAMAVQKRLDMRIAAEQVYAAERLVMRARGEWFPVVAVAANYGDSGNGPVTNDRRTSGVMINATMPFFEGGRIVGAVKEAVSRRRQAELQRDDLSRQVEEDVRKALWTLTDSVDQVDTSARVVELARQEMELAGHRFSEGVADHIEVVNAQTSLAQAREGYVAALTQYHAARINLYFALGEPEAFFLQDSDATKGSRP